MTTKDQERKALEQIRKIVAALGEGSYIGIAFDGVIDDAEENIENDFGCSWKQRADGLTAKVDELEHTNEVLQRKLEHIERCYELEADAHQKELHDRCEWAKACKEYEGKLELAEVKVEEQALEIMKLKAKLFDLMFSDKIAG